MVGGWVEPFAGDEEVLEGAQIVAGLELASRVFLLDGAEGGGRDEQAFHAMLGDDAPERAGIRGAHGLAFVQHAGAAGDERGVHDVGMAHHPADVRGGPEHLAGAHVVDGFHAVVERHRVAAVVAQHPLGLARGAGRVEDVERVRRIHFHPAAGGAGRLPVVPIEVAWRVERGRGLLALQDDAVARLVGGALHRGVKQRLVGDDAVKLDAAGRREDHFRPCVVDAGGEFWRRESAEHHRMHGAQTGAGQHRRHRLRHHRHVDQHAVALGHAEVRQAAGQTRRDVQQFAVSEAPRHAGGG